MTTKAPRSPPRSPFFFQEPPEQPASNPLSATTKTLAGTLCSTDSNCELYRSGIFGVVASDVAPSRSEPVCVPLEGSATTNNESSNSNPFSPVLESSRQYAFRKDKNVTALRDKQARRRKEKSHVHAKLQVTSASSSIDDLPRSRPDTINPTFLSANNPNTTSSGKVPTRLTAPAVSSFGSSSNKGGISIYGESPRCGGLNIDTDSDSEGEGDDSVGGLFMPSQRRSERMAAYTHAESARELEDSVGSIVSITSRGRRSSGNNNSGGLIEFIGDSDEDGVGVLMSATFHGTGTHAKRKRRTRTRHGSLDSVADSVGSGATSSRSIISNGRINSFFRRGKVDLDASLSDDSASTASTQNTFFNRANYLEYTHVHAPTELNLQTGEGDTETERGEVTPFLHSDIPGGLVLLLNVAGAKSPTHHDTYTNKIVFPLMSVLGVLLCVLRASGTIVARKYWGKFDDYELYQDLLLTNVFSILLAVFCVLYLHYWVRSGAFEVLMDNCMELSPAAYREIQSYTLLHTAPACVLIGLIICGGSAIAHSFLNTCGITPTESLVVYVPTFVVLALCEFAWFVLIAASLITFCFTSHVFAAMTTDYCSILNVFVAPRYEQLGIREGSVVSFTRTVQERVRKYCVAPYMTQVRLATARSGGSGGGSTRQRKSKINNNNGNNGNNNNNNSCSITSTAPSITTTTTTTTTNNNNNNNNNNPAITLGGGASGSTVLATNTNSPTLTYTDWMSVRSPTTPHSVWPSAQTVIGSSNVDLGDSGNTVIHTSGASVPSTLNMPPNMPALTSGASVPSTLNMPPNMPALTRLEVSGGSDNNFDESLESFRARADERRKARFELSNSGTGAGVGALLRVFENTQTSGMGQSIESVASVGAPLHVSAEDSDKYARRALILRLEHQLDLLEVASDRQSTWVSALLACSCSIIVLSAYSITVDYSATTTYVTLAGHVALAVFVLLSAALPSLRMGDLMFEVARFHTAVPQICDNRLYMHVMSQKNAGMSLFGVPADSTFLLRAFSLGLTIGVAVLREVYGSSFGGEW